jgi:hypothetical protein
MALAMYRRNGAIATLLTESGAPMMTEVSALFLATMTNMLRELFDIPLRATPYWKDSYGDVLHYRGVFCAIKPSQEFRVNKEVQLQLDSLENELKRLYQPIKHGEGSLRTPITGSITVNYEKELKKFIKAGWHAEIELKLAADKQTVCFVDILDNHIESLSSFTSEPSCAISLESEFMRAVSQLNIKYALALMSMGMTPKSFEEKTGVHFLNFLIQIYDEASPWKPFGRSTAQAKLAVVIEAAYKLGWAGNADPNNDWWNYG